MPQWKQFYPGWYIRIYHDTSVPEDGLVALSAMDKVELVNSQELYDGALNAGAYFKLYSWHLHISLR
jgi:hypothetical protein